MENKTFLEDLKFGTGDGNLHYYFYNWKCPEIAPEKVSSILPKETFLQLEHLLFMMSCVCHMMLL